MPFIVSLICTILVGFLCIVQDAFSAEVTLSWDPSTTNADGTPLTDLAGYKVCYGTMSRSYSQVIDVGNVTTYTVTDLSDGTFYFAVTAYDMSGNESDFSNEVSKTVKIQYMLSVNKTGNGTVTGLGIDCGSDCSELCDHGTVVSLDATPDSGSSFTGWSGACIGIGTCVVTMDAAKNVIATFTRETDKPTSTITQPLNGSHIYTGTYTIRGTADDGAGSGVQKVEVSTDGGMTWDLVIGTTTWSYEWTIPSEGSYTIKSRATDNAGNVEIPSTGVIVTVYLQQPTPVTVNGRQLLVNGNPFTIKGVGYSPVPTGDDPETMPPHGDYFTANYSAIYTRDLPLLRSMGANTIRLWSWDNTANHLDFLDETYNSGVNPIYVIAGFWINGGLDINPSSPDNVRAQIKADFRQMVAMHKNHPAILMWVIGNELNAPWMYGGSPGNLFSLINEMATEAHAEDPYHPVSTPLADVDLISTITTYNSAVPSLDVWGANLYRGKTFGSLFTDYTAASGKPLVILEYGIDAYDNAHKNEYEKIGTPFQADYADALWNEIEANSDVCIGGTLMAYSDEWWKGKHGTGTGCPDNNPSFHSTCGYATSSHPDGFSNEEWWGIMRTVDNGNGNDLMEPRAAYYRLQSFWNRATVYEDAEDGTTEGWVVYDNIPAGATITNVFDATHKSRVIQLTGSGTDNGYRLRSENLTPWGNSSQFVIEWSMNYAASFVVYVDVETTAGQRYLYYTPVNYNALGTGQYVHHGLGSGVIDGKWRTFVRDLRVDLKEAQPTVTITKVNAFLIRGSGKVDDIKLR